MFTIFNKYPNLVIAMSSKDDGPMSLSYQGIGLPKIQERRKTFLTKLGIDIENVVTVRLAHGKEVVVVGENNKGKIIPSTDALITKDDNVFLSITVADCMPIFFYDPKNKVIALAHAGWKGLAQNIIIKVIDLMEKEYDSNPNDILVAIGPSIGPCHYWAKPNTSKHFFNYKDAIVKRNNKEYIDLRLIADDQLQEAGILGSNIEISEDCTYCQSDKYFSWRKEQPGELKTMMVVFGMK